MVMHVIVALVSLVTMVAQAPRATDDEWQPLRFLIGTWSATTDGGAAGATADGRYVFRLELGGHVLARHAWTAACAGPDDFDCAHGDLLYVFRETAGGGPRAIYFDSEGHVIHYAVTTPRPDAVVLESPASDGGPQFRLSYERHGSDMRGRFETKLPGRDFQTYLAWSGTKQ